MFLGFFFCCYCKTTQQDQLKDRKGLFWLGIPERCDPSWWGRDDHDQGRYDDRNRKLGWSHCIPTQDTGREQEVEQDWSLRAHWEGLTSLVKDLLPKGLPPSQAEPQL